MRIKLNISVTLKKSGIKTRIRDKQRISSYFYLENVRGIIFSYNFSCQMAREKTSVIAFSFLKIFCSIKRLTNNTKDFLMKSICFFYNINLVQRIQKAGKRFSSLFRYRINKLHEIWEIKLKKLMAQIQGKKKPTPILRKLKNISQTSKNKAIKEYYEKARKKYMVELAKYYARAKNKQNVTLNYLIRRHYYWMLKNPFLMNYQSQVFRSKNIFSLEKLKQTL